MMRKRIAAVLLACLLLAVWLTPPVSAVSVYFTAINNTLKPLRDETMPISYNGIIYVPYSVFNSLELGTYALYSSSAQAATVFGNGAQLIYDLKDGTTYDNLDTKYSYKAVYTNGRVYVPAAFTCRYFDINYSAIYGNELGTIIRMTVGAVMDDETFSSSAAILMRSRYDDYLALLESQATEPDPTPVEPVTPPSPPVTPTPVTPPTPSGPDTQQPVTPPVIPPALQTPDYSDVEVSLSFFGLDAEAVPSLLDALERYSYSACFFLRPEELAAQPDLVRRIAGSGHSIGLLCGEDVAGDYKRGAALLYDAARTSAFLVALDASGEEALPEDRARHVSELGPVFYCLADEAVSLEVAVCRAELAAANSRTDLRFLCDGAAAEGLPAVLKTLNDDNYTVLRLTESRAQAFSGG